MKLILVISIIWTFPVLVLTNSNQNELKVDMKKRSFGYSTSGDFERNRIKRNSQFVTDNRLQNIGKLFLHKFPFGNHRLENDEKLKKNGEIGHRTDLKQNSDSLETISRDNVVKERSRFKRSGEKSREEILREILYDLKETLKEPENYRHLKSIIKGIQEQLQDHTRPARHSVFLQNILNSFMKRRFNSWGGKRDLVPRQSNGWGGRRNTLVNSEASLLQRQTRRRFNAWGGKRSFNSGPDTLIRYPTETEGFLRTSALLDRPNMDLDRPDVGFPLDGGVSPVKSGYKLLTVGLRSEYSEPDLLRFPADTVSVDSYMDNPFMKRGSFSAWGGKRNVDNPELSGETDGQNSYENSPEQFTEWENN